MPCSEFPCAASVLVAPLLDAPPVALTEVARTRMSVHYETGHPGLPVLCVCTPEAVRLPNAVITSALPPPDLAAGDGRLRAADHGWRVARWWRPPTPRGLPVPGRTHWPTPKTPPAVRRLLPDATYHGLAPEGLVGAGPGLTPAGDDILAGALVTAHATGDPRLESWVRSTRHALEDHTTTAVSRGMLHAAIDGQATPQLAACLEAACSDRDLEPALACLLRVGDSSGVALWHGITHTLTTRSLRRAA